MKKSTKLLTSTMPSRFTEITQSLIYAYISTRNTELANLFKEIVKNNLAAMTLLSVLCLEISKQKTKLSN